MGACERIKNTPIPFSYSIFLKKFIFFYIVTLPIGFVAYFEYWAIPISVFVFYVLVSLEINAKTCRYDSRKCQRSFRQGMLCMPLFQFRQAQPDLLLVIIWKRSV